ncbi:alkaline phosphatase D family protein [Pseudomonas matsuisoli]|uniref:PhoD-like phosphatase n=1 Tax=Pseudomonas matsuisoli TaxID=1515666 RepID=A0A917UYJ8_9PSED|nr:alkaline phosphatase D family protein [Pseudomonas matsuisoli]GGJ95913.1 hypothetical protein GCM10009304_22300 [Pseudomonas matsuisoli]
MTRNALPDDLPAVLAGPLLRRIEAQRICLWLVGSEHLSLTLQLQGEGYAAEYRLSASQLRVLPLGTHAFLHLIDVELERELPVDQPIAYDLLIEHTQGIAQWAPHLCHANQARPDFVLRGRLDNLLHGSCRKPHHPSRDGLSRVDDLLATAPAAHERPAVLLMTGDQIYADDVAGPMLVAIHRLIERLQLFGESLDEATTADSDALYAHPATYYRREELLPAIKANRDLRERFFGGTEKPIFTSSSAHNHLVTLAEVFAMYLLVWSPTPWTLIDMDMPALAEENAERYRQELPCIEAFRDGLPNVARALAHIPTLMIFDDHDISDDWNLSTQWEMTAYGHPFSRQIVGNALIGYLLCQGWGNQPNIFGELLDEYQQMAENVDQRNYVDGKRLDALIENLSRFQRWGYHLEGTPTLIVLDTRTRRWRSEFHPNRPSGLMDWEALVELQQALLDQKSAVIVSPAPMFGVKLIEAIQRIFTWTGNPLMVDAENWMAHRGAAQVMMNIFRHSRTPGNYVILSGDVHYSFVYDIHLRHRDRGPNLWQVTSSGIKNEFPRRLLDWFDRLNRWLYAPWSPLNWLTKRRDLEVVPRVPDRARSGERLWNGAGIGQLHLNDAGEPVEIIQHNADHSPSVRFHRRQP